MNKDLLSQYFDNTLSASEMRRVEDMVKIDPVLKSDFELQRSIVDGLKQHRVAELKTRLSNIPVSGSGWMPTSNGSLITGAAATVSVGVIAFGGFLFLNNQKNKYDTLQTVAPKRVPYAEFRIKEEKIELDLPNLFDLVAENGRYEDNLTASLSGQNEELLHPVSDQGTTTGISMQLIKNVVRPNVIAPEIPKLDLLHRNDAAEPFDDMATSTDLISSSGSIQSSIDVTSKRHRKYNFHYKYSENKLYLFGAFDQGPYELLEISNERGLRVYLFYDDQYYPLSGDVRKVTPLVAERNPETIAELNVLKVK